MLRPRFAFTDVGGWDRLLGAGAALVVAAGFVYLATAIDSWIHCQASCTPMGCGFTFSDRPFQCDYGGDYCASLDSCRLHGRCLGGIGKPCAPATDAHCAASYACRMEGRCHRHEVGGQATCRPGSAADCEASEACRRFGRCSLVEPYGTRCRE